MAKNNDKEKSLEQWLWDAACAIRGAQDAPKYKDYILPLVFAKRLCDVFDDEVNRVAEKVKSRKRALELIEKDHKLVRFYLPLRAKDIEKDSTWDVVRLIVAKENESIGQQLTDIMRSIARENKPLDGIINRIDFNATTHGQRDIDDDQLNKLISKISEKRLGLYDVEPDIIGRSYEYLIRKFAEGGGQSAGEFYTPREVGMIMARILNPEPGMEAYDPNTGSAGLLIKMQLVLQKKMRASSNEHYAPLRLFGQEFNPATWAMANMNMVIHDIDGQIAIGNTMTNPSRFDSSSNALKKFDLVTANPMWNQDSFSKSTYDNDELNRFGHTHPDGSVVDFPPSGTADWGWAQHILASMKDNGRAAIILDTGSVSRGSGSESKSSEKDIRKWFVENDLIEGVIYLPNNLFYNTPAAGIILFLNKTKSGTEKQGKILMLNATRYFIKGNPKNFIDDKSVDKIVDTFSNWNEVEKFSRIVSYEEIEKHDFNLSPSKYIHTADDIHHQDIGDLISRLHALEEEASLIDVDLNEVLKNLFIESLHGEETKESEIGPVPVSWDVKPLKEICEKPTYGYTDSASKTGNAKFLRITDITDDGVDWDTVPFCNCPPEKLQNYLLKDNDILFARIGATTGKSHIIKNPPTAVYASYLIRVRAKKQINPDFLYLFFNSTAYWKQVDANKKNNLKQGVSGSVLQNLLVPVPPLPVQLEAVKIFTALENKINFQKSKIKTLQFLFNSLLHQFMTGKIHLKDEVLATISKEQFQVVNNLVNE